MSEFNLLNKNEKETGQVMVIFVVGMFAVIALLALVVEGFNLYYGYTNGDVVVENACQDGAEKFRTSGIENTAYQEFVDHLEMNDFGADSYAPKVGTTFSLTRGFEYDSSTNTWFSALSWEQPTVALFSLFGIDSVPFTVKSRCVASSAGGLAPIAVRRSAVEHSLSGGDPQVYTILGRDPKWDLADIESGENFRGAVFMHMWCIPSGDKNCPDIRIFSPLTEKPPSAATQKKVVQDCFLGINCNIYPQVGTRLPIVGGTSNAQICKAFQDAGWKPGDNIPVIVYPNEVYAPDPTFSNWENVVVDGYAVYQIVSFEPNDNNCNHVKAKLVSTQIYTNIEDIPNDLILMQPREIQWDYQGVPSW